MDRTPAVRKVLIITLLGNCLVSSAKVLYGYLTGSIAMISDGFHSLFDGVSNIAGLIGIWIAAHPPDRDHPYGHRKYETLFTLVIAGLIFMTSFQILKSVIHSFTNKPEAVVTPLSFIVMTGTLAVNIVVMLYETRKGRELESDFLIADAKHTKSDILATIAVIISLVLTMMGYRYADSIVGIVITVLIARIGYGIVRNASDALVDTGCIDTFRIEEVVSRLEGIRGCHDIRTRGTAYAVFVDLHVLVDPALSIEAAHSIADSVEAAIKEKFPSVADIVVHTEPEGKG